MDISHRITGVMVQYYMVCPRQLWFFSRQIGLEFESEDVRIGRLIHKRCYAKEKKNIIFEEVAFDFIKEGRETIIFEIKKSSKLKQGAIWQLYYYLWYAKHKLGRDVKGMIVYPLERKREEFYLHKEIEERIEYILRDIRRIISMKHPPEPIKKRFCRKCSYFSFCRV